MKRNPTEMKKKLYGTLKNRNNLFTLFRKE